MWVFFRFFCWTKYSTLFSTTLTTPVLLPKLPPLESILISWQYYKSPTNGKRYESCWRWTVGNTVSAIVFWPLNNESLTATSFLLICLAVIDNLMLFFYYLLIGLYETCSFYNTCHYYKQVRPCVLLSDFRFTSHSQHHINVIANDCFSNQIKSNVLNSDHEDP